MELNAMNNLSYGLFVVTAKMDKDNGCITNTVMQITTSPNRISLAVNKNNLTHDMIMRTGKFNVSIISQNADFELFKHFGFVSGKTVDKFADFYDYERADNGVTYITKGTNAVICAQKIGAIDMGTHTLFIADVTDCFNLSSTPSATYAYYHANIKPKRVEKKAEEKKEGKTVWVCKICGYEHEAEELPDDFICPLCKHPKEDFEKIIKQNNY